jgi:hypothetical protein
MVEKHFSLIRTPSGDFSGPITNPSTSPQPPKTPVQKRIPVLPRDYQPIPKPAFKSVKDSLGDIALDWEFAEIEHEIETDTEMRRLWGISAPLVESQPLPPEVLTFKDALHQSWCHHSSVRRLYRLCDTAKCPSALLERSLITEIGYRYAIATQEERRRQQKTRTESQRRKKKSTRQVKKKRPPKQP